MNYKIKISFILFGLVMLLNHLCIAQPGHGASAVSSGDLIELNIADYSLIESNISSVALSLSTPSSGASLSTVSNSDIFLKLSSINQQFTTRLVTSKIISGTVPLGTILKVVSAPCTTLNSGGNLGVVTQSITLTTTDQNLITGIGSCYTGTGNNDGYQLTYTWGPTSIAADYNLIKATTSNVNITVVHTISAAN